MKINMSQKINEATWTVVTQAENNGCGVWLRALDTDCGTLYFVEHESKSKELKEDYLGWGDYTKARKMFNKAFAKITKEFIGL